MRDTIDAIRLTVRNGFLHWMILAAIGLFAFYRGFGMAHAFVIVAVLLIHNSDRIGKVFKSVLERDDLQDPEWTAKIVDDVELLETNHDHMMAEIGGLKTELAKLSMAAAFRGLTKLPDHGSKNG